MKPELRVLFAGGGTGGHVYPAIAIAEEIRSIRSDANILFVGTRDKIEWEAVPRAGFNIKPITVSAFHRTRIWRNLTFPAKLLAGLWQSRRIVKAFRPHVAVGTGGYVSGPVLWAAARRNTPIVLQEQNAFPGKTTKMLADKATEIHIAFAEATSYLPEDKCVLSGNPTRRNLADSTKEEALSHFELDSSRPVLVVMGGSLGSAKLNQVVEQKYPALLEMGWSILWQTGKLYFDAINARIPAPPENMVITKFIHRMDHAYAAADVALCRSGAITCSELAVTGTPSVLVPSPNVAEDHQTINARSLAKSGAAIMIAEQEIDRALVPTLQRLISQKEELHKLADGALRRGKPQAAQEIAQAVLTVCNAPEEN